MIIGTFRVFSLFCASRQDNFQRAYQLAQPTDDHIIWHFVLWHFLCQIAWEATRFRDNTNLVLSAMWNSSIPMQFKIVVWKHLNNISLVDVMVKWISYQLASRWICCSKPQDKSIQHFFLEDDLTSLLWFYFVCIYNVPWILNQPIYSRLAFWFHSCCGNSHFAILGHDSCCSLPSNLELQI